MIAESIPVGQSIDSVEYEAFKEKNDTKEELNSNEEDANNKQDVEEAVIKIQALIRGHLTRKALKDANQAANGPNALGQSQFDAESLMKNRKFNHSNIN